MLSISHGTDALLKLIDPDQDFRLIGTRLRLHRGPGVERGGQLPGVQRHSGRPALEVE